MKRYTLAAVTALLVLGPWFETVRGDAALYTVQNLGTFNGEVPSIIGVNAAGQVVGNVNANNGQAVRYTNGVWHALPGLEHDSFAYAINSAGDVVGYHVISGGAYRGFHYRDGFPLEDIPLLPGAPSWGMTIAYGINDAGDVVGSSDASAGTVPVLVRPGLPPAVLPSLNGGYAFACGINTDGRVAGVSYNTAAAQHGTRVDPGSSAAIDIQSFDGTKGSVYSCAIDADGRIGGQAAHGGKMHAFLYTDTSKVDVDTFLSSESYVESIRGGVAVGWYTLPNFSHHAFVYRDADGTVDLNTRIDAPGWVLGAARGVNANGVIVGDGTFNSLPAAWIATPATPRDTTPPVIAPHADETAEATSAGGAAVAYAAPATTDNVDGSGFASCAPASGSTFALGTTVVTCNATDAAGNAATPTTFNVTVRDTTAPVITAHADVTAEATGAGGASVAYSAPATTDAVDGGGTATCAPASGSAFALGSTVVTCNATDGAGNAAAPTTFSVIVRDTTAPVIAAHADVTAEATGPGGAVVAYTAPSTTDTVDGSSTAACMPASGSTFALGTTTVTCNARDAAGNAAAATTFNVVVKDTTAPDITSLTATPGSIWPPNGKFVPVSLTVSVTDAVDASPSCGIAAVSGAPASDYMVTGPLSVSVRADRNADGSTRIYGLRVDCSDHSANTSSAVVTVTVSKDAPAKAYRPIKRR